MHTSGYDGSQLPPPLLEGTVITAIGVSLGLEVNVAVNVLDGNGALVNVMDGSRVYVNVLVRVWLAVGVMVNVGIGLLDCVNVVTLGVSVLIAIMKSFVTIPNNGHQIQALQMLKIPSNASEPAVIVFLLEAFMIVP